ncbi:MAG: hypothetical protein RML84_03685 [Anaerolineae bacterium]|nr:hypothetical protein [Anaerolineae bacterium]
MSSSRLEGTSITKKPLRLSKRGVIAGVGFALLVGHFAPWASHHTAALTLSAHDLAVFTNYTPGAGIFWNEWFLLPLWVSALLLAHGVGGGWGALVGLLVAALGLPSYPAILTAFRDAEHQLRFFASVLAAALSIVFAWLPKRTQTTYFALILLNGIAGVPLVGFLAVRPAIQALYGSVVAVGWGWWLTLLALLAAWGYAGATIWRSKRAKASAMASWQP